MQSNIEEYNQRLNNALNDLPSPHSFKDAMIALRGIKKIDKENEEKYLNQIYQLAALNSFFKPYSKVLEASGFCVLEIIPVDIIRRFEINYYDLGYEELLLSKTDIKELVELYGEPKKHTTLIKKYASVWRKYELMRKSIESEDNFFDDVNDYGIENKNGSVTYNYDDYEKIIQKIKCKDTSSWNNILTYFSDKKINLKLKSQKKQKNEIKHNSQLPPMLPLLKIINEEDASSRLSHLKLSINEKNITENLASISQQSENNEKS